MTPVNDAIMAVLNRAADEVLEAVEAGDEGARDVVNLIVNLTAHRLDFPDSTLGEAIEASYNEDPLVVLGWCRS